MALVSMRQLLDHAAENGYGLPAFNVNNLEQVQAIMEAASETDSPVIMQASAGARKYANETFLKHLIQAAIEAYPHIPIVMHQDHGQSPAVCESAINLGFSSVMMDGSLREDGKTIADYDYNVGVTRKVVDVVSGVSKPIFVVGGAEDDNPSPAVLAEVTRQIAEANRTVQTKIYADAGHAFLADYREVHWREGPAFELWDDLMAFFDRHLR